MPLSKDQSSFFQYTWNRDLQTCLDALAQWFSFNMMLFRRKTKPHIFTNISFQKKALSTLNIYKIVIRLKSQVLRKEDSRLVADKQKCNQFMFFSSSKPLEDWTDALNT